jgi:hypothetical protein
VDTGEQDDDDNEDACDRPEELEHFTPPLTDPETYFGTGLAPRAIIKSDLCCIRQL